MATLASSSYLLAAFAFAALAVVIVVRDNRGGRGVLLLIAATTSVIWAALWSFEAGAASFDADWLFVAEGLRGLAWLTFVAAFLNRSKSRIWSWRTRNAIVISPFVVFALGMPVAGFFRIEPGLTSGAILLIGMLGLCLVAAVNLKTPADLQKAVTHLSLAMVGIFGFDVLMQLIGGLNGFSSAGQQSLRALTNAIVVPFLVSAIREESDFSVEFIISRQAVCLGGLIFLATVVALLGANVVFYFSDLDETWHWVMALALVSTAGVLFLWSLFSKSGRRKAEVWFSKHFLRNRYDYRTEWRKLNDLLYKTDDRRSLAERCIGSVATILRSRSGMLFMQPEGRQTPLVPVAAWQCDKPAGRAQAISSSLAKFLESSQWIVDTRQYREEPDLYRGLELPDWLSESDSQKIIVPLLLDERLIGMIVLDQVPPVSLTYEDTDLLKIVSWQISRLLAQQHASEALAENRQLQTYSRLTAFVMHDLKNLAAQLALVVKNATRHRDNPDFVDDAFTTISHSADRMDRLISQLAERDRREKRERVDVVRILNAAINRTNDRFPRADKVSHNGPRIVMADRDRLFSTFLHVLRNAQDACEDNGEIGVDIGTENGMIRISVKDNGVGMDEEFIGERLFRPFDSTKGVDGMGIGAFQVRDYVREIGGYVEVNSTPGSGTTLTIRLPAAGTRAD